MSYVSESANYQSVAKSQHSIEDIGVSINKKKQPNTLFLRFIAATIGGVIIVMAACVWVANTEIAEFSRRDGEFHNEMLARTIQAMITPELLRWMEVAPSISADNVARNPDYLALEHSVSRAIVDQDVLKIEIYLSDGAIVYNHGIHEFKDRVPVDNSSFWNAVDGVVSTDIEYNEEFLSQSGELSIHDSVSSYIPIKLHDEVVGVFEIYSDYGVVNDLAAHHFPAIAAWVVAGFLTLYAGIAIYVWRAQRALVDAWAAQGALYSFNARLAAEKRAAEAASTSKSAFLATMSHELRSPLHAVIGFSEEGLKSGGLLPPSTAREYFAQIREAGASLLTLVNTVLDMSRLEAGKVALSLDLVDPVDTVRVVVDEFRPFAEKQGDHLEIDVIGAPIPIQSDEMRLRQILRNLIQNAIKFTENGLVSVQVRSSDCLDWPVEIVVADTGVGIADDDLERLFAPFSQASDTLTRRHDGAGLGLAIVRELCGLLECDIAVVSREGEGSAFTLRLPNRVRDVG